MAFTFQNSKSNFHSQSATTFYCREGNENFEIQFSVDQYISSATSLNFTFPIGMQWTWAKYGWINPIVINLLFCSSCSHEVLKKFLRKLSLTRLLRLIPLAYQTSIFTCTKVKFTCPRQWHPFFFLPSIVVLTANSWVCMTN